MSVCRNFNLDIDCNSVYGHCSAHFDDVIIVILINQYLDNLPVLCPTGLFTHTRHKPARHLLLLHWAQDWAGNRPMRCRYCADPDQCPARSWWTSMASNLLTERTGGGSGETALHQVAVPPGWPVLKGNCRP